MSFNCVDYHDDGDNNDDDDDNGSNDDNDEDDKNSTMLQSESVIKLGVATFHVFTVLFTNRETILFHEKDKFLFYLFCYLLGLIVACFFVALILLYHCRASRLLLL